MNTSISRHSRNGASSSPSRKRRVFSSTPRHKRSGSSNNRGRSASGGSRRFSGNSRSRSGSFGGGRPQQRRSRVMPTFDPSRFINTNPIKVEEVAYKPTHTFETFGLNANLVTTIIQNGMTIPTPIQDQIIPEILKGRDVVGLAETGTGKTAAFLIPLLDKALASDAQKTLILTPTRELALQIQEELRTLSKGARIFSTLCVGGANIYPQVKGLRMKNHFIIGTPGRVLDLIKRGSLYPQNINTVVLDEADRMLDMGFIGDVRKILEGTPKERETLLFSATMVKETENLVHDFLKDPITVSVKKSDVTSSIEQDVVSYDRQHKFETLTTLLEDEGFRRVIIFGAMKHSVEKLAKELTDHGIKSESIHGNKTHSARQRSLKAFKSGHARILVATDVAARGIHVDGVTHVINYDLPNTFEDYVHRIGRTGRGSRQGKALTFIPR